MSYPGNPTLSEAIRERVLATFGQTLALAEQGKRQEALLGCEFVLKLDPQFELARALQRRLAAAEGPIAVQDLARLLDAKDLAAEEWDLAAELADLLDRRDFPSLLQLGNTHQARVAADPDLARLLAEGKSRLEAEPYVRSFLDRALQLRKDGHDQEAEAVLVKARQLDPTHPELLRVSPPPIAAPELLRGFDVETAAPAGADDRIGRLLAEGQQAFAASDYQGAIDSWSRIFLIDIDHAEANRRIEEARRLKAERERQLEELFHEGASLAEIGSKTQARRVLERVLEIDPAHMAARDALDRLESSAGDGPADTAAIGTAAEAAPEAPFAPFVAPSGAAPRLERRPPASRATSRRARPAFWAIGGAVLLLVVAGAWWLYAKRQGLFPNSAAESAAEPSDSGVLARAQQLQGEGQTASAITLLRRLPASHPQYDEARSWIAQWETLPEGEASGGASADRLGERERLLGEARAAADRRERLRAVELLERAAAISPLAEAEAELLESAQRELSGIARQVDLFQQGDWEFALPDLWRAHQADPTNPDVGRLIVDSYYNLAVRDLQRQDIPEAVAKLQEGLALAPRDAGLQRLVRFAGLYTASPLDLRYHIFVKYLPFR